MKRLIAILLFCSLAAHGTTYYVRTDGDNSNGGLTNSAAGAWRNIWYAANTVSAGDTVYIGSGTFNEFVTNNVSGTAGNVITFIGTRGVGGSWDTIVDPSTSLATGWYAAPFGSGTYSNASLSFTPREVEINGGRVMGVKTLGELEDLASVYASPYPATNGVDFFGFAANKTVNLGHGGTIDFWPGIKALWAATNNVLYFKYADGSDPNGTGITAAPNATYLTSQVILPTIRIENESYITYSNLSVRGGFCQFLLKGASTHHITIASNYISAGYSRVYVQTSCSNNLFFGNHVVGNYYGTNNTGAWGDYTDAFYNMRTHLYSFSKYMMNSNSTTFDRAIDFSLPGNTNVVAYNYISNGIGTALQIIGNINAPAYGTEFCSNTIVGFPSEGISPNEGQIGTKVHDNWIIDCNSQIRCDMDIPGETNRLVYIYRNRFWLPDNTSVGNHVFLYSGYTTPAAYHPYYYFYHNSCEGGAAGIADNGNGAAIGGHTNLFVLNNIFNDVTYYGGSIYLPTNAAYIAMFDYNLIYPSTQYGGPQLWLGSHNVTNTGSEWAGGDPALTFTITTNSLAYNAALDTSSTWVAYNNETYRTNSALPDSVVGALDMGAVEYSAPPIVITNRVQYTEDLWIK